MQGGTSGLKIFKLILKILGFALAAVFAFIVTFLVAFGVGMDKDMFVERPLGECTSPDGKHVCSVYVSDGGVTIPTSVVAQVRGPWIIGKRTVYAVDNIEEATFRWIDNRTVRINGIDLDIYKDYYGGDIYDLEPK